jgi:prepilin-type N-terminal cleavage/methylation domain-containing protein
MNRRPQNGFTLYELLITLLIVGVVLSLGLPNMAAFTRNSRISSASNDLHAAFHLARSEAARAKNNITICASANSTAAAADCGGTWDQGFIVFVDTNADQLVNGADESILRAHPAAPDGISLAVANDATYFMYGSSGFGRRDAGGATPVSQIIICDDRGTIETSTNFSAARLFVATPLGRATIVRDLTAVDSALTTMGKSCP